MARKKRSDRNHIIYQITNLITQEFYIGVTVTDRRQYHKSLHSRWLRHLYKANVVGANYTISENIRQYGADAFEPKIIKVIRGKAAAFSYEAQLINEVKPQLNLRMQRKEFLEIF